MNQSTKTASAGDVKVFTDASKEDRANCENFTVTPQASGSYLKTVSSCKLSTSSVL